MSNIWKYSSLTDRQRMKMIREGNEDVYTTEKAKNKLLKGARQSLGMSTSKIDNWDNAIDEAMNNARKASEKASRAGLPKFMSTRQENAYNERMNYLDKVTTEYENSKNEAVESAQKKSVYLAEWLIANGYSKDGSTYKKGQSEIQEQLVDRIEELVSSLNEALASK